MLKAQSEKTQQLKELFTESMNNPNISASKNNDMRQKDGHE